MNSICKNKYKWSVHLLTIIISSLNVIIIIFSVHPRRNVHGNKKTKNKNECAVGTGHLVEICGVLARWRVGMERKGNVLCACILTEEFFPFRRCAWQTFEIERRVGSWVFLTRVVNQTLTALLYRINLWYRAGNCMVSSYHDGYEWMGCNRSMM